MVEVDLKHIHKVTAKGKVYYYAWRGGPRLSGEPGSIAFLRSYNEALEQRRIPDATKFRALVTLYRASPDYLSLAASTKKNWAPWLDRIATHFGELPIAVFDRPDRIKPSIRKWRGQYADKPRTADYGMQVLSRVLSYAVDPLAKIGANPCDGIKKLYKNDRSSIIWSDEDLATILAVTSKEVGYGIRLAALTGLRAGDLFRVTWNHVQGNAIVMSTGKSLHKRQAFIPIYDELRELLDEIPKRAVTILTNSRKRPWTKDGFGTMFAEGKQNAGFADRDLHFHDLRGTAATKFYMAGLSIRVIAEIMAWDEGTVDAIIRRYVSRTAATEAVIRQLAEAKAGTDAVKLTVKPSEN